MKPLLTHLLFFLTLLTLPLRGSEEVKTDHPVLLASYPRSGNTWMRYCLEYLTKRPSFQNGKYSRRLDQLPVYWQKEFYSAVYIADNPLGLTIQSLKTDLKKPSIVKCHYFDHSCSSEVPIIFLLRDYMECIIRENKYYFDPKTALDLEIEKGQDLKPGHYFSILRQFDMYEGPKLLVYYEDLMLQPKETLTSVLQFLKEDDSLLDFFIKRLGFHKKQSLKIYENLGKSDSKGEDFEFHKRKISKEEQNIVEETVMQAYPDLWQKYLTRYKLPN